MSPLSFNSTIFAALLSILVFCRFISDRYPIIPFFFIGLLSILIHFCINWKLFNYNNIYNSYANFKVVLEFIVYIIYILTIFNIGNQIFIYFYQSTIDICIILLILYINFEKFKYKEFIEIDGSFIEGGGQIIRNSMAYASILQKPIHIINIRSGRKISGLRDQHYTGISLISQICGDIYGKQYLIGNYIRSSELKYYVSDLFYDNKKFKKNELNYFIDSNSKASISLMIQICLPLLLFLPQKINLKIIGGTNASQHAPHIDYVINIFLPVLYNLMNININIKCIKRGYLPNGGGICILKINPIKNYIPSFNLTNRGNQIQNINGLIIIHTCFNNNINDCYLKNILKQITNYTQNILQNKFKYLNKDDININSEIDIDHDHDYADTHIIIQLFAETNTKCLFGSSDMKIIKDISCSCSTKYIEINIEKDDNINSNNIFKQIAINVCNELINDYTGFVNSCTDKFLQDQLIIFMALAKGKSKMIIGSYEKHTQTAIHFAQVITGAKFNITKYEPNNQNDTSLLIECQGIGHKNQFF